MEQQTPYSLSRAIGSASSATTTSLAAAPSGGNINRVWRLVITSATAQDFTIQSASTSLGVFKNVTQVILDFGGYPWFTCAANEAFQITNSGAVVCNYIVDYTATSVSHMPATNR